MASRNFIIKSVLLLCGELKKYHRAVFYKKGSFNA